MPGEYVAPRKTPVDHESLRAALVAAWSAQMGAPPAANGVSMLLAQSAFETDRWSGSACRNWNLAGIKSDGKEGLFTFVQTEELLLREEGEALLAAATPSAPCELVADQGGDKILLRFSPNNPMCRFKAFQSLEEAAGEFVSTLMGRYHAALSHAQEGDVAGFVDELRKHGYFTGEEDRYRRGVDALYDAFRDPCLGANWEIARALSALGYWPADDFKRAAMRFQLEHACRVDGDVGPQTRAAIRTALAALDPKLAT